MVKRKTSNKEKDNAMVYKANKLIEARYSLHLNEQKIILYAASQINSFSDERFPTLKLSISEFFRISGSEESKNHEYISEVAKGLMNKQLEIETPNGGWDRIQWVTRSKYEPQKGIISFEFHPALIPYLLKLEEHYRGYPLQQVMQLKSKYSIRLYELLIQWEFTKHKSLTIQVEELRKKMGLLEGEYERFTNFETYVIKAATTELNDVSNIYVTYEKIKQGRSIHEIKFKFDMKNDENIDDIKQFQRLKDAGLASYIENIKKFFNDDQLAFSDVELDKAYKIVFNKLIGIKAIEEIVEEAIYRYMLYYYEYTKEKANRNAYNYYIKALEEDYGNLRAILKYSKDPTAIEYNKL
ncbi:replication initiation protein [Tissierella carlieri]|uniref:Replication initiation protein n=1 Tax=Tissierella carlieri TaxID=689904 RepID=A0ABT1SEC2_9FIRM|nr:replication initiation protein [Tissierella carlieri]MCQ4924834.1 replication initiation protein [Tissierella carlieri]